MARQMSFAYRDTHSWLNALDPVTKFVGVVAFTFIAFGTYIWWAQVAITIAVFLLATVGGRISLGDIWRGTWYFAIASIGFFVVQSWSLPGAQPWFVFAGHQFYADTINFAFSLAVRIYIIFVLSLIFVRTTNPRDLAVASVQVLRVPYRIAYSLFVALRIIPLIEDQFATVRAAQSVRGVGMDPGIRGRIRNSVRYALPVLVGVMREANVMVLSMESRAFGAYPTRTFVDDVRMGRRGVVISVGLVVAVVVWYVLIGLGVINAGFLHNYQ
ncbi:MAG TPA: energy-coupling factor transporter transmembrane component T [Candidatus Limnocylindrales bacterium]|nr:energy-coupling factor transporter transmembrane component T [Candidatus Limnocylindrales bacterium]